MTDLTGYVQHYAYGGGTYTAHRTAQIHETARIGARSWIAPHSQISEGVWIGEGSRIGAGSVICADSWIYEGVWIRARSRIGEGSVVGADPRMAESEQRIAELEAALWDLRRTVAFFASVIRSGEAWSEECETALRAADADADDAGEEAPND